MTIPALNPFRNIIGSAMAANAAVPLNQVYVDTDGRSMNPLNQAYSYGQMPFDLDALVEEFRQRRIARVNAENAARMQQIAREAPANVAGRRQSLIELGRMGPQPLANPAAAERAVMRRLPGYQRAELFFEGMPTTVREIPGIGRTIGYSGGGKAIVGKYGTGTAVARDKPDPKRMIEGMPAAEWFAKKAGEQGVSNRFATAVPTGVTDKQDPWGVKPRFTGKAVVADAMSKKK